MRINSYKKIVYKGIVYYVCIVDTGMGLQQHLLTCCYKSITWKNELEKLAIIREAM